MAPSILRHVLFAFLVLGTVVAAIFPFYASLFVEWKPGMLPWFVAGCFVAGVLIGVANYYVMNVILVSKLKRISEVAGAIARKDLTFQCSMQSEDTIGDIIKSFNAMAASLRDLIERASRLSSEVRTDSDGIRDQSQQIHDRIDELAARTREISQSIQALADATVEISTRGGEAAGQAAVAGQTAREGISLARGSLEGMARIHDRVSSATERVQSLERSAQDVGAIVQVIREIADQTNLLALNAAIEAARAGEQGRGFAVVADEVRKLAEKTAEATQQIGQMIAAIQSETDLAIAAIGDSMREARIGVEDARKVGDALGEIAGVIEGMVRGVAEIAASVRQQESAVGQVRLSLDAIETLNTATLAAAETGVVMSEKLTVQANSLDAAVKSFRM